MLVSSVMVIDIGLQHSASDADVAALRQTLLEDPRVDSAEYVAPAEVARRLDEFNEVAPGSAGSASPSTAPALLEILLVPTASEQDREAVVSLVKAHPAAAEVTLNPNDPEFGWGY